MGNVIDELKDVMLVACEDCNGAGIIFWGDENNFDCEPCDCVTDEELI